MSHEQVQRARVLVEIDLISPMMWRLFSRRSRSGSPATRSGARSTAPDGRVAVPRADPRFGASGSTRARRWRIVSGRDLQAARGGPRDGIGRASGPDRAQMAQGERRSGDRRVSTWPLTAGSLPHEALLARTESLRGLPAIGRGCQGAIRGTNPLGALIPKETRRSRTGVRRPR